MSTHPSQYFVKSPQMIIRWKVGYTGGPMLVRNPDNDIFDSFEEAKAEAENRGPGWQAFLLDLNVLIEQLTRQNATLRRENEQLRNALDG